MSDGVEFPAASVLRHAASVSRTSEQLAQARSAVREVTMDNQAYGQLCQFLPGLFNPLFGSAIEAMNEAVDALDETATKLRATTSAMRAADISSANRLTEAGGPGIDLPL